VNPKSSIRNRQCPAACVYCLPDGRNPGWGFCVFVNPAHRKEDYPRVPLGCRSCGHFEEKSATANYANHAKNEGTANG
jgi:hypothetical protein